MSDATKETVVVDPVTASTQEKTPELDVDALFSGEWETRRAVDLSAPSAKRKQAGRGKEIFTTSKHIIPTSLACIVEMTAINGVVRVDKVDGTNVMWPASRVNAMAGDCMTTLAKFEELDRAGKPVTRHVHDQMIELCQKATAAAHAAMHQNETIGRYDKETRSVDRVMANLEWQKGLRPERGEYTEDHLGEKANIKHYIQRFQYLSEGEISAVLRADDIPWKMRIATLKHMNGKKMAEEMNLSPAELEFAMKNQKLPESAITRMQGEGKQPPRPQTA